MMFQPGAAEGLIEASVECHIPVAVLGTKECGILGKQYFGFQDKGKACWDLCQKVLRRLLFTSAREVKTWCGSRARPEVLRCKSFKTATKQQAGPENPWV